jgi:signal peptidase I
MSQLRNHLSATLRWYTRPKVLLGFGAATLLGFAIQWADLSPIYLSAVVGNSMEPTLHNGDLLLVCRFCQPKVGDIVVVRNAPPIQQISERLWADFNVPPEHFGIYIKRVAAVAGQPVPTYSSAIWKSRRLPVALSLIGTHLAINPGILPSGSVWLLGDNTLNSIDSRFWGTVPNCLMKGSVVMVFGSSKKSQSQGNIRVEESPSTLAIR